MQRFLQRLLFALSLVSLSFTIVSCRPRQSSSADAPRLTPNVSLQDVTFHSASLDRDIQYRVILPKPVATNQKYSAIYLLHGGGGNFRDWSNYSDAYKLAERGFILIMPEGHSSYYTNAASRPKDRYEDYITKDLISDVEQRFPVAPDRSNRAILGVSMGGFGAIKLALVHPDLYAFAGGLSPALDAPSRPFSVKRIEQWNRFRAIFGAWQGQVQSDNDPFLLVKSVDPAKTPYIFLSCGEQEGLLSANNKFSELLKERNFQFEYHSTRGNHDWSQWNNWLPTVSESLTKHWQ
jgi:S-formylglutathione hydrolase FrmB